MWWIWSLLSWCFHLFRGMGGITNCAYCHEQNQVKWIMGYMLGRKNKINEEWKTTSHSDIRRVGIQSRSNSRYKAGGKVWPFGIERRPVSLEHNKQEESNINWYWRNKQGSVIRTFVDYMNYLLLYNKLPQKVTVYDYKLFSLSQKSGNRLARCFWLKGPNEVTVELLTRFIVISELEWRVFKPPSSLMWILAFLSSTVALGQRLWFFSM